MGLSSLRWRPRLVARLGDRGFQGVYSLIALALFVPLVRTYFTHKHAGPHLWYLGQLAPVRGAAYAGMALALVLLVGGVLRRSPAGMGGGGAEVRGVLRLTRHPVFMALGLYGLVHLAVANVNAAELAFFAGFPLFALAGCWHQDRRLLVTRGESYRRFHAATAFLPFTRPGAGRGLAEMPAAIALGIAAAVVIRHFHPGWFGGV
jgi:uncharacterized membrane protein